MKRLCALFSILLGSFCHADALKTVYNPFTGKLDYINVSSSGGIVSPGTFTWTNTQGIAVSTISISTIPFTNEIPYRGTDGYLVANTSFTYGETLGGSTGIENLKLEGQSPYIIFASSNAMGWNFFDGYHNYANAHLWGSISIHPNAFPSIAQGNLNPYMRDGSFIAFDTTGQGTNDKGFFAYRVAHPADEATPRTVFQANTTGQVLIDNTYENCAGVATDQSCKIPNSIMFLTSATVRGAIPCPRMSTTQRNAISTPYDGLCIYDITVSSYSYYSGPAATWWYSSNGAVSTPGGSSGQLQYNSASALGGVSNTFVGTSSVTFNQPVVVSTLSVNSPNNLAQVDITVAVPNGNAPAAITGSTPDNHTAIFIGDTSLTTFRKLGIEWTGYRSGLTGYAYGGIFGQMTSTSGNTIGAITIDMRATKDDTAMTEYVRFTSSGTVGISTGAPQATLDINGTTLHRSTATFYSNIYVSSGVYFSGLFVSSGTSPALTSCGSSPTLSSGSNNFAGTITAGSTSSGCTLTFATGGFANTPTCVISNQSMSVANAMTYTVSTTALTISETALGTSKIDYICLGH